MTLVTHFPVAVAVAVVVAHRGVARKLAKIVQVSIANCAQHLPNSLSLRLSLCLSLSPSPSHALKMSLFILFLFSMCLLSFLFYSSLLRLVAFCHFVIFGQQKFLPALFASPFIESLPLTLPLPLLSSLLLRGELIYKLAQLCLQFALY